ncbi:glycosyltransferase [Mucilaginibacter sp. AW1-7]|uniref:glycosyltransferase n=1 Tax=unclassified Mucilaginibacter TaxID=2617802 RepID=UPI0008B677CC|nr:MULTISPECIES: glycosyltransferase [unclassified Mucilaginibacter]WDF75668.1 glycosyltransferase [Mucilaginibacter sp. KACC 22773]SEP39820.1 Glycosyltransferase involved in cell wall bisynthesis [Mucilaginibacter sp. OK283]
MEPNTYKLVFVSMSDQANGAENILLMCAATSKAPLIFLKKVAKGGLKIPFGLNVTYVTKNSLIIGFLGVIKALKAFRTGHVIVSTHPYLNAYLGLLKRIGFLKSKVIVRECTSVFTRFSGLKKWSYQLSYRLGYPAVDLVVCQTKQMRCDFIKNVSFVIPESLIVQPNPLDIKQNIVNAKAALNDADAETEFICAAGRLIPEKGFLILIAAFNILKAEFPGLKLLIFGDGPQRSLLEKLIAQYQLSGRVILKGWVENPMPYFKLSRACVVSSIKEGFPNVLLQMMSLNPKVVCTKCAGGIEDIEGVFKADINSESELTNAIRTALNSTAHYQEQNQHYLDGRSPQVFIHSIMTSLIK